MITESLFFSTFHQFACIYLLNKLSLRAYYMVLKHIRKLSKKRASDSKIYKELAPFMNLGLELTIPIGLGAIIGWQLDKKYDSDPTWLIVCSLIGIVVGFYIFFKTVLNIEKNKKKKNKTEE